MNTSTGAFEIVDGALAAAFIVPIVCFDLRQRRIPDALLIPALLALAAWRLLSGRLGPGCLPDLLVGFGVIIALRLASGGKIGLGDAKLSAFLAFLLGLQGWFVAVFLASLSGVVYALVGRRLGRMTGRESLPFAPFLAAGAAAAAAAMALFPADLPADRLWLRL